jgi:hypothetical protein
MVAVGKLRALRKGKFIETERLPCQAAVSISVTVKLVIG